MATSHRLGANICQTHTCNIRRQRAALQAIHTSFRTQIFIGLSSSNAYNSKSPLFRLFNKSESTYLPVHPLILNTLVKFGPLTTSVSPVRLSPPSLNSQIVPSAIPALVCGIHCQLMSYCITLAPPPSITIQFIFFLFDSISIISLSQTITITINHYRNQSLSQSITIAINHSLALRHTCLSHAITNYSPQISLHFYPVVSVLPNTRMSTHYSGLTGAM